MRKTSPLSARGLPFTEMLKTRSWAAGTRRPGVLKTLGAEAGKVRRLPPPQASSTQPRTRGSPRDLPGRPAHLESNLPAGVNRGVAAFGGFPWLAGVMGFTLLSLLKHSSSSRRVSAATAQDWNSWLERTLRASSPPPCSTLIPIMGPQETRQAPTSLDR